MEDLQVTGPDPIFERDRIRDRQDPVVFSPVLASLTAGWNAADKPGLSLHATGITP